MNMIREFYSNFIKIRRTPIILLHLLPPVVITALFFIYYAYAGHHIIPDVRIFFVLLQICYPIFVSIVVPVFIHLDRDIVGIQNSLGVTESRTSTYLGKLLFLLFLSAVNMILYELCFAVGANFFPDMGITDMGFYQSIISIFLFSNLFLYLVHVPIAFRFGSSISVLLGICGTITAGFFENAIGDTIWPAIPWEWGVRFLKHHFGLSHSSVSAGRVILIVITLIVLILSIRWFCRWEGKFIQE